MLEHKFITGDRITLMQQQPLVGFPRSVTISAGGGGSVMGYHEDDGFLVKVKFDTYDKPIFIDQNDLELESVGGDGLAEIAKEVVKDFRISREDKVEAIQTIKYSGRRIEPGSLGVVRRTFEDFVTIRFGDLNVDLNRAEMMSFIKKAGPIETYISQPTREEQSEVEEEQKVYASQDPAIHLSGDQRAAYINSQSAAALAEAMGMQSTNTNDAMSGVLPTFTREHFLALVGKYRLGEDSVVSYLLKL